MCLATQASTLGSLEIFSYCGCDRWSNGNAKHMIFFFWYAVGSIKLVLGGGKRRYSEKKKHSNNSTNKE